MLKVRFRDIGLCRIERGQFALRDTTRQKSLDLSKPWNAIVRPGQHISMSMIYRFMVSPPSHCPGCGHENKGWAETEIEWYIEDAKILVTMADYISQC